MGDVNSIIAAPYQPNMQSNMQALSQGNALLNAFDAQSAAKEAGPMAAAGDWEGARNSLLGAGQIDQAAKVSEFQQALQDRARKMSDEKLSDAAKTWGLVGNGAVYADTPEKYSTLLSVLSKNGIDVSPYKDFTTGRQAALALSGQAKTILDQEKINTRQLITEELYHIFYKMYLPFNKPFNWHNKTMQPYLVSRMVDNYLYQRRTWIAQWRKRHKTVCIRVLRLFSEMLQ